MNLSGENFQEELLYSAVEEFPDGFGRRLKPTSAHFDLDKWRKRDWPEVEAALRHYGVLVIEDGALLKEPQSDEHKEWGTIRGDDLVWLWHNDELIKTISLTHLKGQQPRKVPTAAAPISVITEAARDHVARGLEQQKYQPIARKLEAWLNNRLSITTWNYSAEMDEGSPLKDQAWQQMIIDLNRAYGKYFYIHDWQKSPHSALLMCNYDRVEQCTSLVHCAVISTINQKDTESELHNLHL